MVPPYRKPKFQLMKKAHVDQSDGTDIGFGKFMKINHRFLKSEFEILYHFRFRPKFLQYRYMYDYRTNYYNDVIEYLDKRAKGVSCEIPRAQTWAERVLRTHTK